MARRKSTALARPRTRTVYQTRTVRRGPSPAVIKARVSAAAKRGRAAAARAEQTGDLYAIGVSLALGVMARKGIEIPGVGEIGTAGAVGLAMYAAPMVMKGSMGKKLRAASVGPLSVAAHELGEDSNLLDFLD